MEENNQNNFWQLKENLKKKSSNLEKVEKVENLNNNLKEKKIRNQNFIYKINNFIEKNKLKEKYIFFKEKINFIHIIVIFLLILWILNSILNKNTFNAKIQDVEKNQWDIEIFTSNIPISSLEILWDDIKKDDTTWFQYLFWIFDLSEINQKKSKTIFRKWIKMYTSVYEIDWWLWTYLKIKKIIEYYIENFNKKWSLFEANNLWVYSFYYNNERKWTVYLVALIWWEVFAFEYNKKYHEDMKIFTKNIAKNIL